MTCPKRRRTDCVRPQTIIITTFSFLNASPMTSETARVLHGDAYDLLDTLNDDSVDLVVTSPPYWGLRTYGLAHNWDVWEEWTASHDKEAIPDYDWYRSHGGILGLEPTPD